MVMARLELDWKWIGIGIESWKYAILANEAEHETHR
jgi:hypothetical protein